MKRSFVPYLLPFFVLFTFQLKAQISCEYTLLLFDSFGDGWNGATLTVSVDGSSEVFTIDPFSGDGSFAEFTFTAADGQELILDYSPGVFENEVTYELYDSEGNLVFADGPFPGIGEVFVGTATCPACPSVAVDNVFFDDIRHNYVDISWIPTDPNGMYFIEYDSAGFAPGMADYAVQVMGSSATLSGLSENTEYEFYITVFCASLDTSTVSGPFPFTTLWANDVGVTEISTPLTDCGLEVETITVTLGNFGGLPQSLIPFNYSVNGVPGGVPQPIDGFYTGVLGNDSLVTLEFETMFDFTEFGAYTIQAWTELASDSLLTNDTATVVVTNIPVISELPYFINFEDDSGGWMVGEDSNEPSWQFGQPAATLINTAASGVNAWVTNLTGTYNNVELSYLVSPCLDFSNITEDPNISFSLFVQTESCCDELWLEVSTDAGANWQKVGTAGTGLNWYNDEFNQWWDGDGGFQGWVTASNVLTGIAGESAVLVRFVFSSDFSVIQEGVGVDDIFISPPLAQDLAAIGALHTGDDICGSPLDQVQIEITNLGQESLSGFDVSYQINGGAVITENVGSLNVDPNEQETFTFSLPFNSAQVGEYEIVTWLDAAGEEFTGNDTTSFLLQIGQTLPFVEDFEAALLPAGWIADDLFPITQFHNNISFVLFDNLWSGDPSFFAETPLIGVLGDMDSLSFDYRFVDFATDGSTGTELGEGDIFNILISTDCGETYNNVLTIDQSNHITTEVLTTVVIQLDEYAGESIKIRFEAFWANGDYYLDIDNINILACPASLDLGATVIGESAEGAGDGQVTINPGDGLEPFNYDWDTGDSTQTVGGLSAGIYSVTVTDAAGCIDVIEVTVDVLSSVQDPIDILEDLWLAPNPTTGTTTLNVAFKETVNARIQLMNTMGQQIELIADEQIKTNQYEIDLTNQPGGLYFIRVLTEDAIITRKLIRTR